MEDVEDVEDDSETSGTCDASLSHGTLPQLNR